VADHTGGPATVNCLGTLWNILHWSLWLYERSLYLLWEDMSGSKERETLKSHGERTTCSLHFWQNLFFFFFAVLGFKLRAYTLSHSTGPFLSWMFFEIESHELFAQAGFKSWSSWSLPLEWLGLQVTGAQYPGRILLVISCSNLIPSALQPWAKPLLLADSISF
jgi:hypothetical protein